MSDVGEGTSSKIKNMSLLCAAFVVSIHIQLPDGLESSSWFIHQLLVNGFARMRVFPRFSTFIFVGR